MNRNNTSTLKKNAWLYSIKFKPNELLNKPRKELFDEFGSVEFEGYRNGDHNLSRKKKSFPMFGLTDHFEEETELFLQNNVDFIKYSDYVGWDGSERILQYEDLLQGKLKKLYQKIGWEGTSSHYDPNHVDAETPEGFVQLLKALFMEYVDHENPAYAVQERIRNMKYCNQRQYDTLVDPKVYKERLEDMYDLVEVLPSPNGWQPATDLEKLNAAYYGLPLDAQEYLKYEKEVDVFDAANNGAGAMEYGDMFMAIRGWWMANYKKKAEENSENESKKRNRHVDNATDSSSDEDADDDDESKNNNTSYKRMKQQDDDVNNDDEEEQEDYEDDEEEQEAYEHQDDDDSTQSHDYNSDDNIDDDVKPNDVKLSFFDKPCLIHKIHPYKQCQLCFTSRQFNRNEADQYYQSNDSHSQGWWRRTYEKKFPKQEQPQQSYYQLAPTYATGMAATTQTAAQARPQLFQMVQDSAGNSYFVQM
jgi:hypothetical protein